MPLPIIGPISHHFRDMTIFFIELPTLSSFNSKFKNVPLAVDH